MMAIRTTRSTVTFRSPFLIKGMSVPLPAGTYDVETDKEIIEGNERSVYRRVATLLIVKEEGCTRTVTVDPAALQAALDADEP